MKVYLQGDEEYPSFKIVDNPADIAQMLEADLVDIPENVIRRYTAAHKEWREVQKILSTYDKDFSPCFEELLIDGEIYSCGLPILHVGPHQDQEEGLTSPIAADKWVKAIYTITWQPVT